MESLLCEENRSAILGIKNLNERFKDIEITIISTVLNINWGVKLLITAITSPIPENQQDIPQLSIICLVMGSPKC